MSKPPKLLGFVVKCFDFDHDLVTKVHIYKLK